jgi:DNA polymerase-3 subunit beta
MKFHVERDALQDAVAWSARTLPTRPALPVLAGLRLDVSNDELTLAGFDYEVSTRLVLPVNSTEGGPALVSGRLLADICRSLPSQPVELATDASRLTLRCGSARFDLPTLPFDEYPALPESPASSGTVGTDAFAAAVAAVAVAAGRDDTLPVMTGVRIEVDGDTLTLAATDRYRLAVRTMKWAPADPAMTATALVPARTLAETAKSMTGAELRIALGSGSSGTAAGSVGADGGESMIAFTAAERQTTTRLLDGEFPKYRALLPSNTTATAEIETAALVEALRRVSLVASRSAPVRLTFSDSSLQLNAGGQHEGEAVEDLPIYYEGEAATLAFNPAYLLDGLGALGSDTARLRFTEPRKPVALTGKNDTEGDYVYVIMPVRLPE